MRVSLRRAVDLHAGEAVAFGLSFAYFLSLLACYYMLRPLRDALVAGLNVSEIKYLSLAVFITMLAIVPIFGALLTHVPRRRLLPRIYIFFVVNLLLFALWFAASNLGAWPARIFYVWLAVFNLFVVSLFWSYMADLWHEEQGRRLFGLLAAGGSIGGLLGPLLASLLASRVGASGIAVIAAVLLSMAVICIVQLSKQSVQRTPHNNQYGEQPLQGSSWQGFLLLLRSPFLLGIAAIVLMGGTVAMFSYTETARLVKLHFETPALRTIFYSHLDLYTNAVALLLQAFLVGRLAARFGVGVLLVGLSAIACCSFVALAFSPMLAMLAVSNVVRRAGEFGLGKPGRDMLYTVTTPQEKYAAKNVIDTSVSRGADFIGGSLYGLLSAAGATLAQFGWISALATAASIALAIAVTRGYRARGGR